MSRRASRRGAPPVGAMLRTVLATVAIAGCVAFAAGQVFRDRWLWSEWMFWMPSWGVAFGAASAAFILWKSRPRAHGTPWAASIALVVAAWSGGRSLWNDVGWSFAMPAAEQGDLVVTHWNPQWPGDEALDRAQALAHELGDLAIVSNPGAMFRQSVREAWVPEGMRAYNLGPVGVVTRLRVTEFRMVARMSMRPGIDLWFAWLVVRSPNGVPVRILVGDLPSSPLLARGDIAAKASAMLSEADIDGPPDLVVGDCNCTPGSVVFDAVAPGLRAAPPWRSAGWLCTYQRPWPMLRIDAMLAAPTVEWRGYRTIDLGIGKHRAQQGVVRAVQPTQ